MKKVFPVITLAIGLLLSLTFPTITTAAEFRGEIKLPHIGGSMKVTLSMNPLDDLVLGHMVAILSHPCGRLREATALFGKSEKSALIMVGEVVFSEDTDCGGSHIWMRPEGRYVFEFLVVSEEEIYDPSCVFVSDGECVATGLTLRRVERPDTEWLVVAEELKSSSAVTFGFENLPPAVPGGSSSD